MWLTEEESLAPQCPVSGTQEAHVSAGGGSGPFRLQPLLYGEGRPPSAGNRAPGRNGERQSGG